MNKELKNKTEEWMKLERKTLEKRKKADEYYDRNLMKLIEKDYCERNRNFVREPVRFYIASVGTS